MLRAVAVGLRLVFAAGTADAFVAHGLAAYVGVVANAAAAVFGPVVAGIDHPAATVAAASEFAAGDGLGSAAGTSVLAQHRHQKRCVANWHVAGAHGSELLPDAAAAELKLAVVDGLGSAANTSVLAQHHPQKRFAAKQNVAGALDSEVLLSIVAASVLEQAPPVFSFLCQASLFSSPTLAVSYPIVLSVLLVLVVLSSRIQFFLSDVSLASSCVALLSLSLTFAGYPFDCRTLFGPL